MDALFRISRSVLALLLTALAVEAQAQDCSTYFPFTKGAELEMQTFNAKDKQTGRVVYNVLDVASNAGATEARVQMTVYDVKGKASTPMEYTMQCKDGTMLIDMKRFFDPETMNAYKDMDVTAEATYLEVPAQLPVGATLQDGTMTAQVSSSGQKMADLSVAVKNRKVAGQESITTPAGTFDATRVTSDVEMGSRAMGIKLPTLTVNSVEWFVKDVGVVRSESFRKGKLFGYSVLTRIQK